MAINPYLPKTYLGEVKLMNELAINVPPREESGVGFLQKFAHSHMTMDEVLFKIRREELGCDTLKMRSLLERINPEHFKCEAFAQDIVEANAISYAFVDQCLKTPEFIQEALINNPTVFDQLTPEQQADPDINQTYLYGMNSNKTCKRFGDGTDSLQYKFQFSTSADKSVIFSEDRYRQSFEYMFKNGAHVWNESERCFSPRLGDSFAYISAARSLCPEMADTFDRIECEVILANRDVIMSKIDPNQNWDEVDRLMAQELLDAVIARCEDQDLMQKFPELKDQMDGLAYEMREKMIEYAQDVESQEINEFDRTDR